VKGERLWFLAPSKDKPEKEGSPQEARSHNVPQNGPYTSRAGAHLRLKQPLTKTE